ncbi:MAG: nucleotidyltransferase domain-containing protein, partial [Firmicutes bacterium]|nr:nucleotidyltransferase domain-containing protein [Bacillota bacterium]
MAIPKNILQDHPCLSEWSILTAYRGSISHGMYVPKNDPNCIDDKDVMAICIPPVNYYYGLQEFGSRGTKEIKIDEWDIVVFEFIKAMRLLKAG